jgi:hypothetical protein
MTLKKSKLAHAVILSSLLVLGMPVRSQEGPVSPRDIKLTWIDKTVVGTLAAGPSAGKSIEMAMKSDGTVAINGAVTDVGTWRLSDQGYCATWKKIRAGQERCFTVIRKGNYQEVKNLDGSLSATITEIR